MTCFTLLHQVTFTGVRVMVNNWAHNQKYSQILVYFCTVEGGWNSWKALAQTAYQENRASHKTAWQISSKVKFQLTHGKCKQGENPKPGLIGSVTRAHVCTPNLWVRESALVSTKEPLATPCIELSSESLPVGTTSHGESH